MNSIWLIVAALAAFTVAYRFYGAFLANRVARLGFPLLTLGLVLWRKGVPKEAAETLRKGLWLEPDNALGHYYLGEALNQAGDLKGARAALEKSAELAPDHGRTFRLLARVLDRMGRYEEAQTMYRRAREVGEA